jgi:hypothetical protein
MVGRSLGGRPLGGRGLGLRSGRPGGAAFGDVTAPSLSSPTDTVTGSTTADLSVSTNEANGTLYWVLSTASNAPSAAQVKAGQMHTGAAAAKSGSQAVSATGVQAASATALTPDTQYFAHFMHEDAAGNQSSVASGDGFTTDWSPSLLFASGEAGVWLDPSDMSTVFTDSAGTTAASLNDPIGRISDKSGRGNHFTQGTSGARPALKQTSGLNYLENDGIDDFLAAASPILPAAPPYNVWIAAQFAAGTLGAMITQYAAAQAGRAAFACNQLENGSQSNGRYNPFVQSVTNGGSASGFPLASNPGNGTSFVHSFIAPSTGSEASTVNMNGVEDDRFTAGGVYQGANTQILGQTTIGFTTVKRLYGLVIVNRVLTAGEITKLRTWIGAKAGLTL